ncbi:MAG TPA: aromatic ring-hydroxylating dioxygenase subunit alpha [Stellaceae bacterium]|nr:aromatic ring-hydroxylating dioxygenase subunit alpha [Stellaceae bacterium]
MPMPEHLFDPAHYAKARLPVLEAETLPPWCYTSQQFYDREVERVFKRSWNFIGREDELPKAGDYAAYDLVGEPVLIVRDRAGTLRAFANSCRHRGTRLLDSTGNRRGIICPYHGWAYGLDGKLIGAAGMEETHGFDKRAYGLHPIRLKTWDGFVFINLGTGSVGLREYLGDLPETLDSYRLSDMVCVRRREYDLACNWKIYLENAMEDYHTPYVHRQSIGAQHTVPEKSHGAWGGIHMAAEKTIAVLAEDLAHALPPIPSLKGKPAAGTYFLVLYPSTFFALTQDCMWWLQQFPQGPARTKVVIGSCFPRATVARADFAEKVGFYYRRWDKSLPEDNAISERQQAGLRSSFASPGRLSVREPMVRDIANWLLDRVLD